AEKGVGAVLLEVGADDVPGEPAVTPDLPEPVLDQLHRTRPSRSPIRSRLSGGCHARGSVARDRPPHGRPMAALPVALLAHGRSSPLAPVLTGALPSSAPAAACRDGRPMAALPVALLAH